MRYFLVLIFSGDGYGDSKCWFRVWAYKDRDQCLKNIIPKFCTLICELTEDEVEGLTVV